MYAPGKKKKLQWKSQWKSSCSARHAWLKTTCIIVDLSQLLETEEYKRAKMAFYFLIGIQECRHEILRMRYAD